MSRRALVAGAGAGAASVLVPASARATLGTGRQLAVGAAGGLKIGFQSYPETLALGPREVVLTFDDGPVPGPTQMVLDALRAEGVKATFFAIGRNAAAHPELARRIVSEGHTLAHHSFSHPWTFRQRGEAAGKEDIERGFRAVEEAAYGSYGGTPRVPFFRYPGFADTAPLNDWLSGQGIGIFGCDLWASDWTPMSPSTQLSLMMRRLRRAGNGILLFHDMQPQTAAMLPAFLRHLREEGYSIPHLVPGYGPPALAQAAPGWRSRTDAIIAGVRRRTVRG
jgi:peptidoglycan-N-acetylglucosamine deacetylase